MSKLKRSLKDVIKGEKKKAPNPEGEKPPCSSKDKDQPQRDEVSKGTDRGTSEDEEKTKGDAKKDEAAGPLEQTLQSLHQMQHYAGTENNNTTLTEKLKTIASDKGFRISDNQGSGNCMFHALSEQLETIKGIKIQHGQLRQSLVQYLRKNSRLPDGTDLRRFVYDHETWANYLTCMEQDGTWGDHVILCAAANCFKTCIHVVRSLNDDVVIRPHGLVDESKPLVLGHIGEVHYVSLQPIKEETPCSSKDKKQPKINVVLTGPDQDTSKKGGKTKEDKKEDQAAEGKTKGGKEKGQAAGGTTVSEDNKELNPLHSAEREIDVTKMTSTPPLERSVDSRNATGITPLMNAVMNGNVKGVKLLIKKGADPSLEDNLGWNSLHFAALRGDTAIISLIYTQMPDTESLNGEGATPLLVAAYNGILRAVKWFLERGANAAYEDKGGWNALHSAASSGDPETIDHILAHVSNIESKTADGETPLIIAVRSQTLQGVNCLLKRGANPLAKDNEGQDSSYYASSGDPILLDLVLNYVANSESTTGND